MCRTLIVLALLNFNSFCLGQENELFETIHQIGEAYTKSLKNGHIESMKEAQPPKDTWIYSKLLNYKKALNNKKTIKYGSFIMPGIKDDVYSYNFFALNSENARQPYYYTAIVSFIIENHKPVVNNAYLFTEEKALDDWWVRTVTFYKERLEGKESNKIPDEYVYPICPPPPFAYSED